MKLRLTEGGVAVLRKALLMIFMCSTLFMATEAFADHRHHRGGNCVPQRGYYTPQYNYGGGGMGLGFSIGGGSSRVYIGQPYYQPVYSYVNQWHWDAWGRWVYGPVLVRIR